ncbi:MAG: ImmA/IrrE family metallo-endopeptidase [Gemmatimonadetes bacterium]|nr:ImmA/IrrE family metallo-endopeptidase [Gemmatimonadota bacterium]MBT5054911.1 ImmA/IrrE family metallo-endopeptidase [Gemmatimonadota bacterium]MBT5145832.1 ImmA/IrrE family metallo-endopeptidase [Gemmatimonadota bacterium]MBT5587813.1 ImmA/IrrE family metallo-endopeptidase [Gemmatimonadota bacterium]MBT5962375.1 ImmA/IrrE family metallo-endopeptidase [Gemmatimonadota bacterium]
MNTTAVGNELEEKIASFLQDELDNNAFWARSDCCTLFRKKAYYSPKRQADITFDIAIEIRAPGNDSLSMLVLVECKNYADAVPVGEIETFHSQIQQVSGANVKGIVASRSELQSGALNLARSMGLGLIRDLNGERFKWELRRSASYSADPTASESDDRIRLGMTQRDFSSHFFDMYCVSASRYTNSLGAVLEDFVAASDIDTTDLGRITNRRRRRRRVVPFIDKSSLEDVASMALGSDATADGPTSFEQICMGERERTGLRIVEQAPTKETVFSEEILGRITFDPPEITIYSHPDLPQRQRFTLAHELSHHLLEHGEYMRAELCQESDFERNESTGPQLTDVARLEWQANYVASCLLLPRQRFLEDFLSTTGDFGIANKGFGALFLDHQPCNVQAFHLVSRRLSSLYQVSKSVVRIRMEDLGLLKYGGGPRHISEVIEEL